MAEELQRSEPNFIPTDVLYDGSRNWRWGSGRRDGNTIFDRGIPIRQPPLIP